MAVLTEHERRAVLDAVLRVIDTKYMGPDVDTRRAARDARARRSWPAASREAFEAAMNAMLKELGRQPHRVLPRVGAAGRRTRRPGGHVHEGGDRRRRAMDVPGRPSRWRGGDAPAIRPGDVLLSVRGKELVPPHATPFALGERYEVVLRRPDGSTSTPTLDIPQPKDKRRPLVVPDQVVTARRLDDGIGLHAGEHVPGRARDGRRARHESRRPRPRLRAAHRRSPRQHGRRHRLPASHEPAVRRPPRRRLQRREVDGREGVQEGRPRRSSTASRLRSGACSR